MHFSLATVVLALAATVAAGTLDVEVPRSAPRDSLNIVERQAASNAGRPVPSGNCCVAEGNLKQDNCKTTAGVAGKCVPGGNACGGALSCISNLGCDPAIIERGKQLCRAKVAGGFLDGAKVIKSLKEAKVN